MVRTSGLIKTYPGGDAPVHALDGVSIQIPAGEFVAIIGASGSGKSTLLHILGGLSQPDAGEVEVDGLRLDLAGERELTQYRRHRLGLVFQFFHLLPTLTSVENTALPLLLQGVSRSIAHEKALAFLDVVGLSHRAKHFPHQLSGGEMQRVGIARALVHGPSLVLADEPTGNLDSHSAAGVVEVLRSVAEKRLTTLVLVTHSREVAACADRTIEIDDGRVVAAP